MPAAVCHPQIFFVLLHTMKQELSILIPTYNDVCTELVGKLCAQAKAIDRLDYEIIVADDGSTDSDCTEANQAIESMPGCIYIKRGVNVGRAAIRNYLARQAAYRWLLFIDSDMSIVDPAFLANYLNSTSEEVVYGGYRVGGGDMHNLRYLYEKAAEGGHTAEKRQRKPYKDFHTSNFMIRRDLMLAHPFDERFRRYGYEDVLFGKTLRQHGIRIEHIDNPVGFDSFEENLAFVEKTEEGLHTLYEFSNELRGYNYLLTFVNGIHLGFVKAAIRLWHRLFGPIERHRLAGRHPNLTIFKIYKLGYYLSLTKKN